MAVEHGRPGSFCSGGDVVVPFAVAVPAMQRVSAHLHGRKLACLCARVQDKERRSKRSYMSVFVCLYLSFSEPK